MTELPRRAFLTAVAAGAVPVPLASAEADGEPSRPGSSLPPPIEPHPELRRGPYLQVQGPDRIVIRWRTDTSAQDCLIRFGERYEKLDRVVQPRKLASSFPGVHDWAAAIDGLSAGSQYYYAVESSKAILAGGDEEHSFRTAPPRGRSHPIRLLVLGDCGTNRVGTGNPGKAISARNGFRTFNSTRGRVDGILLLGDNAYSHGTDSQYQTALFSVYREELSQVPVWPCVGNHELTDDYFAIFSVPERGEIGGVPSNSSHYYSFDLANAHVVVLDLWKAEWLEPRTPQRRWLEADLAANRLEWTIVANHFPPYCDGKYESDTNDFLVDVRQRILPVLEAHGVDLLLTGHDHTYQRSYLLDGHHGPRSTFDPARHIKAPGDGTVEPLVKGTGPHSGIICVVTGTAGAPQLADPTNPHGTQLAHPAMVKLAKGEQAGRGVRRLGSFLLEIDGQDLTGTQVDERGDIVDRFRLHKRT